MRPADTLVLGPSRSIAPREAALRASVFSVTRRTPQTSKACVSISSLQAALTPVRWAEAAYQVLPISATEGGRSAEGSGPALTPGGHGDGQPKTSRSRNRVEPTTRWPARRRTANGTARPWSRPVRACCT